MKVRIRKGKHQVTWLKELDVTVFLFARQKVIISQYLGKGAAVDTFLFFICILFTACQELITIKFLFP